MDFQIWSATDKMFCHFGPFFVLLPPQPKKSNFEKLKKNPGDIITLHKCTKSHDHMLYCFLDMIHNGFTYYFLFWAIFHSFTSLATQKNQNLEKVKKNKTKKTKKTGDIIILQWCAKNHDHMLHCS